MTFAEAGFEAHYKSTRREQFLTEMDRVVPWREPSLRAIDGAAIIAPYLDGRERDLEVLSRHTEGRCTLARKKQVAQLK